MPYKDNTAHIDKIIADSKLTSLITNKQWVKLLNTLVEHFSEIKECRVKLIGESKESNRRLKISEFVSYNFDYYDNALEGMISGSSRGWYDYKEIEWLDFPLNAISYSNLKSNIRTTQNLEYIFALLNSIDHFKIVMEEDNLRLYAYASA